MCYSSRYTSQFLSPRDLQTKANKAGAEVYKTEKFKVSLELELKQLNADYKKYQAKPEDHPKYGDEWKKFWNRRYLELKKEGKVGKLKRKLASS